MPNNFDAIIEDLQTVFKRNPIANTSVLNAVTINAGSEQASTNRTITKPNVVTETVNTSFTPAMTIAAGDETTFSQDTMTLSKTINMSIRLVGEDDKDLMDSSQGYASSMGSIIEKRTQNMLRTIETNVINDIYLNSCRAVGTAGTTPFASNIDVLSDLEDIFAENEYEDDDISFVGDFSAFGNLRKLDTLQQVNTSGSDETLRRGLVSQLTGFNIARNKRIASHTAGTGSGYLINNGAGYSVGDTSLTVDTGTGTILAGDVINIGNYDYVVKTALTGGVVVIQNPGLMEDISDNDAITVRASHTANLGFIRSAVELAIRPMAKPEGGDAAKYEELIQLGDTGITLLMSYYGGDHEAKISVTGVYNSKVWMPEGVGRLMG